ncbi:MAG TPA: putative lipid II flippase FtsW [Acidimicrobiales bacterium]|nr:putative lipid II flippase FtsW [Acidimicrobiales bacterium]
MVDTSSLRTPSRTGSHAATRGRHPSSPTRTPTAPRRTAPPTAPSRTGLASRLARVPTATGLIVLVGVLCVFGLVMVGSASPVISMSLYGSTWGIFIRQVMWMGIGVVAMLALSRIDYRKWRKIQVPLLIGSMGTLVMVLMPGLGVTAGGSSRWIGFGQFRIQPSELMKLALIIFVADLLTRRVDKTADTKSVILPVLIILGIAALLILKQPDMGTALVLCCVAFGMLFMGGVPVRPILKILLAFAVLAVVVGLADPYRRDRILSFLNPGANHSGSGYQVWQSLIGLGSGHLFGLGLGGGRQKWGLLPNAHTDFIFSVVGEELGLVGAVLLLGLFFLLAWYGLRAATRAPDRFGSLVAIGITVWITSQTLINIGAVIGVLPVTGIPLPFVSFGGSSLVMDLAAVGILLNIAGHERLPRPVRHPARRAPTA